MSKGPALTFSAPPLWTVTPPLLTPSQTMEMAWVMISGPKPPGSRQSISPPAAVLPNAPAKAGPGAHGSGHRLRPGKRTLASSRPWAPQGACGWLSTNGANRHRDPSRTQWAWAISVASESLAFAALRRAAIELAVQSSSCFTRPGYEAVVPPDPAELQSTNQPA